MAKCKFNNVSIEGIVTVVPPHIKYIDDEIEHYGGDIEQINRIKQSIGLNARHVVDDKTTTLDLCYEAAKDLLSGCDLSVKDVDGLIAVTQTPDYFQPANANILHGLLQLDKECVTYDVRLGCSGYVHGLWLAYMMISSGTCNNVILVAGDTLSKCVNKRDRTVAPLFGDAGSATLITKTIQNSDSYFNLNTDGSQCDIIKIPAGAFRQSKNAQSAVEILYPDNTYRSDDDLYMDGVKVFNFFLKAEPKSVQDILSYAKKNMDYIDYFIFHQANKYVVSNIARKLNLSKEKVPTAITEKYGNQASASIPCTINDMLNTNASSTSLTMILSGFGVGLSWGSCIINLSKIYCPQVKIYTRKHHD
jgi:3-oxoacyl-[acyl-carrier-protein] synthase III